MIAYEANIIMLYLMLCIKANKDKSTNDSTDIFIDSKPKTNPNVNLVYRRKPLQEKEKVISIISFYEKLDNMKKSEIEYKRSDLYKAEYDFYFAFQKIVRFYCSLTIHKFTIETKNQFYQNYENREANLFFTKILKQDLSDAYSKITDFSSLTYYVLQKHCLVKNDKDKITNIKYMENAATNELEYLKKQLKEIDTESKKIK